MSVSKPGNPNDLTEVTTSEPGNPTSLTGVANQVLPRSIQPYINFDFANNVYEVNNQGTSLTDAVLYTRASSGTFIDRYIDENNQYQYFLNTDFVGTVTNNFTYSEDLQNSDWIKSGLTLASNADLNPLKTARNAFLMQSGGVGSTRLAFDATVATNTDYNISAYMKAGTNDWVAIYAEDGVGGNTFAYFNIKEGYIGSLTSAGGIALREPKIQFITDGWYRISVATTTNTDTTWQFRFYFSGGNLSLTTASDDTMYIWGLQLTQSVKPEPYVQTFNVAASKTFSATPRLEYDAATGESLGYLAERGLSNLVLRSETFDTGWALSANLSIDPNVAIAPDLTKSADGMVADNVDTTHNVTQAVTVVDTDTYTISVYAKAGSNSFIFLYDATTANGYFFDLVNGVLGSQINTATGKIVDVGNGWYRCSSTVVASGTTLNARVRSCPADSDNDFAGDGSTVNTYIWGFQVEKSPYATSYIRTTTASAPRSGDNMWILVAQPTEVTMFVEANYLRRSDAINNGSRLLEYNDNTATSRIIFYNQSGFFSGYYVQAAGVVQASDFGGAIVTNDSFNKAAFAFKTNYFRLYENGVLVSSDDAGIIPTVDELDIAHTRFVNQLDGHLKKARIYNLILTDDEVSRL